jgi:hypothetical protein
MLRTVRGLAAAALLAALPAVASAQYAVKETSAAPPAEVKEPVRKLLGDKALQVTDAKGTVLCELWFRKEIPAKATPQQVKNGLTYREIPETTLVGVIRITDALPSDYRKQKIKAGVYTLRLAFQPMDGDHMGTAPNAEFLLAVPAAMDKGVATMEPKELHELSTKASGTAHPAVFLLFPEKGPDAPKMAKKEGDHWVLTTKLNAVAGSEKATIGIGLTLIGVSSAA